MKKRRFSVTEDEASLIISALAILISELEKHYIELTVLELNQLTAMRILKNRLEKYQWWV